MAATTQHLGVAAMFAGIIAGRLLSEAGLRALTTAQEGMLVEVFADLRRYHLIALAVILPPALVIVRTWSGRPEERAVAILARRELSRDASS